MNDILGFFGSILFVFFLFALLTYALEECGADHAHSRLLRKSMACSCGMLLFLYFTVFIFLATGNKITPNQFGSLLTRHFTPAIKNMMELIEQPTFTAFRSNGVLPLYPLLAHILGRLCFGQYALAAVLLSTACMGFSISFFYLLHKRDGWLLLFFPLSFLGFLSAPDSLSLLLSLTVIYTFIQKRDWLCFVCCLLFSFCDPRAILVITALFLLCNEKKRLWVCLGLLPGLIMAALLFHFQADSLSYLWFLLPLPLLFALVKNHTEIHPQLVFGLVLILAGILFPAARPNLLLAYPSALALQMLDSKLLKIFLLLISCLMLAFLTTAGMAG